MGVDYYLACDRCREVMLFYQLRKDGVIADPFDFVLAHDRVEADGPPHRIELICERDDRAHEYREVGSGTEDKPRPVVTSYALTFPATDEVLDGTALGWLDDEEP